MKVLIVGGGGREHAIAWRIYLDSAAPEIFCAPGNAGTESIATNIPLAPDDISGLTQWAEKNQPDLTIAGPEIPLCLGITNAFEAIGLRVFGPSKEAAAIEGSKKFSKEIMAAAGVPTARSEAFTDVQKAVTALDSYGLPVVIKADGLAAGKGVIIAESRKKAVETIEEMLTGSRFGEAGSEILIEEYLAGEEASILALTDGENAVLLPSSQDHKRAYDNDKGPNTGGMGAYSPAPVVPEEMLPVIKETIILPVIKELKKRGTPYKGVLYGGLMISGGRINVLEFNARFGDPETEAVLPRIDGDLIPAFEACIDGNLKESMVSVKRDSAVTVVMASGGYPGAYSKGIPITGLAEADAMDGCVVFHAGTKREGRNIVTSGGRVLSVTALGSDLRSAVERAYKVAERIHFEGAHFRKDIAHRAFSR
ncbi:MAG: phosphoribosylamine--glycine ligase [Kiritimatiellia bacterium]